MDFDTIIDKLSLAEDLEAEELEENFAEILDNPGTTSRLKLHFILRVAHAKGESATELFTMAKVMRARGQAFPTQGSILDIVGTGGDESQSVNIATTAALVAAACGARVVKHGLYHTTERSGAAEVLHELGIELPLSIDAAKRCLEELGMTFLMTEDFYPPLHEMAEARGEIEGAATDNMLVPLLNPANPQHLLLGVYDVDRVQPMAEALKELGTVRSYVFHGHGIDDLSPVGTAEGFFVQGKELSPLSIDPQELGIKQCTIGDLRGATPEANGHIIQSILKGEKTHVANAIALSAGVGLWLYGTVDTWQQGFEMAQEALSSGKVEELHKRFSQLSQP